MNLVHKIKNNIPDKNNWKYKELVNDTMKDINKKIQKLGAALIQ